MGVDPLSITAEVAIANALINVGVGIESAYVAASAIAVAAPYLAAAGAVGGALALSSALAPEVPKQAKQYTNLEGADRYRIRGRARVGSGLLLHAADAEDLYRIAYLCQGEISGIEEIYINDRLVARDGSARIMTGPYRTGPSSSYVRITTRSGTVDQTVFGNSNGVFGSKWPSTSRGLGMALVEGRYSSPGITDHQKIYPAGGYPEAHIVALAPVLYDPRVTGASYLERASWVWADNGVLNVASHLTDPREEGGEGWPVEMLHWEDIAEEAWKADATIGGEPRSRCWGVRSLGPDQDSKSAMASLLLSTGTTILPTRDGRYTIRLVDDNPVPTGTLDWRYVIGDERTAGPQAIDRPNRAVVKYYAPERDYEVAEADLTGIGWAIVQDEIDRWGERTETIDLPWCPSAAQAGRIARRLFALKRAAGGTRRTTIAGMALMGHEIVSMPDDELGITVTATVTGVRLESLGGDNAVSITYLETPALTPWDPATDAPGAPVERGIVPDGNRVSSPVIRRVSFVKTNYGGNPKWAIRVNVDVGGSFDGINVIRRTPSGRTYSEWTVFPLTGVSGNAGLSVPGTGSPGWYAVQTEDGLSTAVVYDIKAEQVKSTVNISDWSDVTRYAYDLTPTAPATPTVTVLSTDGVTSAIKITSSWDTSYFIVRNSSGTSIINGGDAKIDGTYQVTGLTVGTTYKITAYSSLDVPSADLNYLIP